MLISVIIPVYNAAPYLTDCLESVMRQTHTEWECICVDDGSTDRSGAILDEYAQRDVRFRVLHQMNGGVSAARNAGMAQAAGGLVTFLDSDDTYDPRALEILLGAFKKTGAEVIRYGCRFVKHHTEDKTLSAMPSVSTVEIAKLSTSPLKRCSLGAATAVSNRLAHEVSWPALTQCEDPLFVLRCMNRVRETAFVDGDLVNYLVRANSASHEVSLAVIGATCRYLVMAYDECAAMPGFANSRADTCAFLAGFLEGSLAKCGRDVGHDDRKAAESAVRTTRNLLAVRDAAFAKFACDEKFDFAFVLGSSCTATDVLRQANLQFGTFPLDWVGRLNLAARTNLIVSDFSDFISRDRLQLDDLADDGRHARYVDTMFGTAFFHDFPAHVPLAESYSAVRAKYDRRISRFLRNLRAAKSVLVIWVGDFRDVRDGVVSSNAALSNALDCLCRKFPDTHFAMRVFDPAEKGASPQELPVADGRIRRVKLDYRDWSQGDESWAIRIEALLPYLQDCHVRDYRSRDEKRAYRQMLAQKKRERFHACSRLDLLWAEIQYRIFRHVQKDLMRKGIRLS